MLITAYPIYDTSQFENDIYWFSIQNKKNIKLGQQNFTFDFVLERPKERKTTKTNLSLFQKSINDLFLFNQPAPTPNPLIDYIGFQKAFSGQPFIYEVNITNLPKNQVTFSDNTELFDISNQGLINFTPLTAGFYKINITAVTKEGGSGQEELNLVVINK